MAYSDFTLELVRTRFGIETAEADLFPGLAPVEPNAWLQATLALRTRLSLFSEKARCETIVSPILIAAREMAGGHTALFSGAMLNVDQAAGLAGECDFILSAGPSIPPLRAPLLAVVEAKKNDIDAGLGQCVAQMIGARRFNDADGRADQAVFGCVTTGEAWQFLRLEPAAAALHNRVWYLTDLPLILGALLAIQATALATPPRTASP